MKQNELVTTINVKRAMNMINYLMKRPKTEMDGMGLISGVPGVGKTRFAKQFAIQYDFVYIRLQDTMTAKSMLTRLHIQLKEKYNVASKTKGSANELLNMCISIINSIEEDVIILIDESDYAFAKKRILNTLRDINDDTTAIIILCGMENSRKELLKADPYYFDRFPSFIEFNRLSVKDIHSVVCEISDFKIENDVTKLIHQRTKGALRPVIQMLYAIETYAKNKQKTTITYEDAREILNESAAAKD
jgi:DNA transposition AAA+ family ATPase